MAAACRRATACESRLEDSERHATEVRRQAERHEQRAERAERSCRDMEAQLQVGRGGEGAPRGICFGCCGFLVAGI